MSKVKRSLKSKAGFIGVLVVALLFLSVQSFGDAFRGNVWSSKANRALGLLIDSEGNLDLSKYKGSFGGGNTFNGPLTVGSDGTGHDVTFYSDTAGAPFYWDSTNRRLGLGTPAPSWPIHIYGSNPNIFLQASDSLGAKIYFGRDGLSADSAILHNAAIGGALEFRTGGITDSSTTRLIITSVGNIGIGTITFGTGAAGVLALSNPTSMPTAGAADAVQLYSTDLSAGNTTLAIYTEGTGIIGSGTPTANTTIAIKVNGTTYYLIASTSAI